MSNETYSLFILKSNPGVLTQAETFLKNRKWIVGSATTLREALAYIIQKQPQYVLLTADHPNRKVKVLPKMLVQAFPCRIICFAEKSSGASQKLLLEMGQEYNLYPPVSGPAIERIILKMKRDDDLKAQQAEENAKKGALSGAEQDNSTITFKGDAPNSDQAKASFEQARQALSQLISSGDNSDSDSDGGPITQEGSRGPKGPAYMGSLGSDASSSGYKPSGPAYMGGVGGDGSQTPGTRGPAYMGNTGSNSQPNSPYTQGQSPPFHPGAFGSNSPLNSDGGRSGPPEQQPGESFEDWSARMRQSMGAQQPAPGNEGESNKSNWTTPDRESEDPGGATSERQKTNRGRGYGGRRGNDKDAPIMEADDIANKTGWSFQTEESKEDLSQQSIIVRGTQQALDETVSMAKGQSVAKIEKSTNIACITVQSPRFSGYLVCALGKNRSVDKNLIDTIQKRLFGFLRDNGESITDKDTMEMKIQEVDFTDWALEQAEFLRKSIHDGDEIAMAFFPTKDLEVQLEDSADEKMVKIDVHELKEDIDLEFDLYIYMPENNKYLLYTMQGRPFMGMQKSRLVEKGVTQMHLRKDSSHNVKKYRAQNFLNEKIASYKQAARIKQA